MRRSLRRAPAALAMMAGAAMAQHAPAAPTTAPADESRMDRLERRLNDMEQQHRADLQARDEEIARLQAALATRPANEAAQPAATNPSPGTGAGSDDIDQATSEMLRDIEQHQAPPPLIRTPANFNPNFAVVGDFAGNVSSDHANPARNRFDLREVELDLRAAVDPRADAVVILPIDRGVNDPLFFDPAAHNDDTVSTNISIEEAYLNLHDFGVPNLTAQLGRFHVRFGRWNLLHLHNWATVDNAFVIQSFLGPESLVDSGVNLSYVIPPNLIGGQYIEIDQSILSGEGESDDPVLNNGGYVSSPALLTHVLWNHDVGGGWNVEAGGSYLYGHHNDDNHQYANLFGGDLTLVHTDPHAQFNNQLIQGEVIYGNVDRRTDDPQHAWGGFLLAQQQINADWYTGVRLDYTHDALAEHRHVWGVSPYLTWYWSEFLRFRLEYQHKGSNFSPREENLYFQVDFVFGAHPPHPYWAMR